MSAAPTTPDLLNALEDHGYRPTGPRRRVVEQLVQHEGSFSPEELSAALPEVGRATVYRTIRSLVGAGVLCKTSLPHGGPRYSVDQMHHHHHIVCERCGRVQEFRHAAVERMLRSIATDVPGKLVGHRIELYVTCEECTGPSEA